ncbi:hypothetical protein DL93DRAFT_2216688 [Clavulina sp. PMI_390]|nr:hypothetical protein DL93DRAFT_2216688 [Clavulina sp. PMI_390]
MWIKVEQVSFSELLSTQESSRTYSERGCRFERWASSSSISDAPTHPDAADRDDSASKARGRKLDGKPIVAHSAGVSSTRFRQRTQTAESTRRLRLILLIAGLSLLSTNRKISVSNSSGSNATIGLPALNVEALMVPSVAISEHYRRVMGGRAATRDIIKLRELNWQSVVTALPPELLSEIFLECVNRGDVDPNNLERSFAILRKNRAALASVCFRWRQVAHATKSLWAVTGFPRQSFSNIVVNDEGMVLFTKSQQFHESFLHDIRLSTPARISLILQNKADGLWKSPPMPTPEPEDSFHISLYPVFSQCENILLEAGGLLPLIILNQAPSLLNVKSLDVRATGECRDLDMKSLDLSYASSIQNLSIVFSGRERSYATFPIVKPILAEPDILKKLTVSGYVDPSATYNIISQASSLLSLEWLEGGVPTTPNLRESSLSPKQILLPLLRHLALSSIGPVSLFPHLYAPNVISIVLKDSIKRCIDVSSLPKPSQFLHLRSLTLDWEYTEAPLLPPLLPEFRALEVLNLQGFLSVDLAMACTRATKLRLVVAKLMLRNPTEWPGPLRLLDYWSSQVNARAVPPLSLGFCFVYYIDLSEERRNMFNEQFVTKHPAIKIGYRRSSPFALWGLQNWDALFTTFDAEPTYLPPF